MGVMKEKKLDKDIKELEEIESKQQHQFHSTRNRLLDYSNDQRRGISIQDSDRQRYLRPDIIFEEATSEVDTKLDNLGLSAADIASKCIAIMVIKNKDYGPNSISNAPGGALNGLNVRLHDKIERLNNLLSNKKEPNNESIRDTFVDIVNYGIISLLVLDNRWEPTK